MKLITRIACRAIGAAGIGLACYDAAKISKKYAEVGSEHAQEHYLEKAYYNSRTTDEVSFADSAISKKSFDVRTKNPLPAIGGKIHGGFKGFMYGLGNYLPVVALSSLALVGKNFFAKLGALGLGVIALYKVLREGFGLGKNNPMH